jgi:hypothetical protein
MADEEVTTMPDTEDGGPLPDGRDISAEEMAELLQATWDGARRIPSPFVEGDYLRVARRPRVSIGEARVLYEWTTFGNAAGDYDCMGRTLGRIFDEWRLTGLDGERIGQPPTKSPSNGGWPWEQLSIRVMGWVINRAVMVVLRNPLA